MTIIIVTMSPTRRFELIYPPIIKEHFKAIESKFWSLIRNELEEQLQFEPDVETKNRKPLKRPVDFGATWEIRIGSENRFRAYYRIDYENDEVIIQAIGEKIGNRVFIGGKEIQL